MTTETQTIDISTIPPERLNLVKRLTEEWQASRKFFEGDFKRMREDQRFHYGLQYAGQTSLEEELRYLANFVQNYVKKRVDTLYAKNPKFYCERKPRMDFAIWDEEIESLMAVQQRAATGMLQPQDIELIMDVQEGMASRAMLKRVSRTLETLVDHFVLEQTPSFKMQMKRWVRRAVICGVAYLKLGFQRQLGSSEVKESRLADTRERIAHLQRLIDEAQNVYCDPERAEIEELKLMMNDIAQMPDDITREGPVFFFPASTAIIPDMATKALNGWIGTNFVCEESINTKSKLKEKFGIDVGSSYTAYVPDSSWSGARTDASYWGFQKLSGDNKDPLVCWCYFYDKRSGLVYTIADGYPDFLAEPRAPDVKVEEFFPFTPLLLNEIETEDKIFPGSDVRLLRSMQEETNRKREARRQHRIANRPLYATSEEQMPDDDVKTLTSNYPDHALIKLKGLPAGGKVGDFLQRVEKAPVDDALYNTEDDFLDVQRVGGASEPFLGSLSGVTATETSVAESSRSGSDASNADDIDDTLSVLGRQMGQVLLREMSAETVQRLVGRGAVWPQLGEEEIVSEIFLTIEGGSSGKPGGMQEVAKLERLIPYLIQIPGIKSAWLARQAVRTLDSKIDVTDAIDAQMPSIMAQNANKQPSTGDAGSDPNAQGRQGDNNAPRGAQRPGGPQAAYPAPTMSPTR